jgi:hypothetical protein
MFPSNGSNNGYYSASDFRTELSTDNIENTAFSLLCLTVALLKICCLVTGMCLPNRCPETAFVYPLTSRSFHSNGCTRYNIIISFNARTYAVCHCVNYEPARNLLVILSEPTSSCFRRYSHYTVY